MNDEEAIIAVVDAHRERFGRLDALVNNAGVGIGAAAHEHMTKRIDMQLDVNVRAIILFYRECAEMLKAAGAEHGSALVDQHGLDRGQVRPGVAVGLLRHQVRRRRLHAGDEQGARRRRASSPSPSARASSTRT